MSSFVIVIGPPIGDDGSRKFPRSLSLPNRREALAWTAIHQDIADAGGAHFVEGDLLRVGRHGRRRHG